MGTGLDLPASQQMLKFDDLQREHIQFISETNSGLLEKVLVHW